MPKETSAPEKIIDLLEAFLNSNFAPMTVAEIMQKSGLKRNSCDRLLKVLEARGYVKQTDGNRWLLGTKILRYSEKYSEFCLNVIAQK